MNCRLCNENENINALWVEQGVYWNVHACWFQHTLGTLAIILTRHAESFVDLTPQEIASLGKLLQKYQTILGVKLNPDWYNIQMNGNWHHHLHFLLLPRYKDSREFENEIFNDKAYGQPIEYTKIEASDVIRRSLTDLLK